MSLGKKEILDEIDVAALMVKDLERLYKSYAKKALLAKEERERKQDKKGFLDYNNAAELAEGYGWALIDEETYEKGLEYFENENGPPELSVIEMHRNNIKTLINRWKGTVKELNDELNDDVPAVKEDIFDKMTRLEREARYKDTMSQEI